jgi:spore germination cell wall hydrolase CwlJ-like protein
MFLALPEIKFNFQLPVLQFDIQRSVLNGNNSTQASKTNTTTPTSTNINLGNLKISPEEQELLLKLAHAEAGGEGKLGMAAVIKSILNRYALVQSGKVKPSEFGAKGTSLKDIISASGQYQPWGEGKLKTALSSANQAKATEALNLALNPEEFVKELQKAGKSASEIKLIETATGFRAKGAFNDPSQNVNNVALGNHTFNTAGNNQLIVFDHGNRPLVNA